MPTTLTTCDVRVPRACVVQSGGGEAAPEDEVQPVVEVGRDAGALQRGAVLKQELPGGGGPGGQGHVPNHPPALALPQRQALVVQQEPAARGPAVHAGAPATALGARDMLASWMKQSVHAACM